MTEGPFAREALVSGESQGWVASRNLRLWLLIGALAVLVAICFSGASCWIDFSRHQEPEGLTITDALDWLCVLPQFVILLAFLALARETLSLGLWRSSIGVYGSTWLMTVLVYSEPTAGPGGGYAVLAVAVVLGAICMFAIIARNPASFLQPTATESPAPQPRPDPPDAGQPDTKPAESEKPKSKASGWGCLSTLGAVAIARVVVKGLRRAHVDWFDFLCFAAYFAFLGCFAVFSIWFGICQIRLRRKLGIMAVVSGWADILNVAVYAAYFVYVGWFTISAVMNEQEPDFFDPRMRIADAATSLYAIACDVLTGALFLSVRSRSKPDWAEVFDAPTAQT